MEIDLFLLLGIIAVIGAGIAYLYYSSKKPSTADIRGTFDNLIQFTRAPTVPTLRIISRKGQASFELGRRARIRGNSLYDRYDKKGWDITSAPTVFKIGRQMEEGYVVHPAGVTLAVNPTVKIIAVDQFGHEMKAGQPIYDQTGQLRYDNDKLLTYEKTIYAPELAYEGTVGTGAGLDDFNDSTAYERSGGWITPFIIGLFMGVMFLSPIFAWLMAMASGA